MKCPLCREDAVQLDGDAWFCDECGFTLPRTVWLTRRIENGRLAGNWEPWFVDTQGPLPDRTDWLAVPLTLTADMSVLA